MENAKCQFGFVKLQSIHTISKYVDKQVKQPQSSDLTNQIPSAESYIIESENKITLYRKIHLLEEPFKEIVLLRILGALSFKEIGEIYLKNENWARVTFYRAKVKLKESE